MTNIDDYRTMLIQRRQQLEAESSEGQDGASTVELDQSRVGRLSRMGALQAQAMSQASQQRRRQELVAIKAALIRMEHDEYGECTECGEPIAAARLQHNPSVALCIDSANSQEE